MFGAQPFLAAIDSPLRKELAHFISSFVLAGDDQLVAII